MILPGLRARADAEGLIGWDVGVDSTITRAHQHAAGARKGGSSDRAAGYRVGWGGAGRSWALPVAGRVDQQAAPGLRTGPQALSLLVTAGQRGDSPLFTVVIE